MMKKTSLVLIFISAFCLLTFGETGKQEEIDFLFFLPNSCNQFVNEEKAMIQLDRTANYLKSQNLGPGKVSVYGYAAAAVNDIEPVNLSRERALYVINELKKRGLGGDLFAEPVACGSVDLWGGNTDEENRRGNRRVRILLGDTILSLAALRAVEIWTETPCTGIPQEVIHHEIATEKTGSRFPWWIIPLALTGFALVAAVFFFADRCSGSSTIIPMTAPVTSPGQNIYVLTEEEIRCHSYELYQQRNGRNEYAIEDWYRSECELTAYYEAHGYEVILYWEMQA